MIEIFNADYKRYDKGNVSGIIKILKIRFNRVLFGQYLLRKADSMTDNSLVQKIMYKRAKKRLSKIGIEVASLKNIGKGLCFNHPYNITINSKAKIGENFTIFKGATIGSIRSGRNRGTPIIGDRVTVCCNAFVCGNIEIGDDVLIAAGAFVNRDVPSNSIVIGNPGVIHHKINPSGDYL